MLVENCFWITKIAEKYFYIFSTPWPQKFHFSNRDPSVTCAFGILNYARLCFWLVSWQDRAVFATKVVFHWQELSSTYLTTLTASLWYMMMDHNKMSVYTMLTFLHSSGGAGARDWPSSSVDSSGSKYCACNEATRK